jgi:TonB family protein
MSAHADILDSRESMRVPFAGAITLHLAVFGGMAAYAWMASQTTSFGDPNAGGAIGVEAVSSIPIPHHGEENPLANDSPSEVPQTVAKPVERVKEEKPPPDAVPLKTRNVKKKPAEVASTQQRYRPFDQLEKNQLTAKQAPQVSTPLFAAMPGSGSVGVGANTTLGNQFAGYATQIQQLVAQHWHTGDVDARIRTATPVIATFDLLRDGRIQNLQILQGSNIPALDFSVKRAILDVGQFPPLPPGFPKDNAKVEFTFELKR